jgi:TonB family protein
MKRMPLGRFLLRAAPFLAAAAPLVAPASAYAQAPAAAKPTLVPPKVKTDPGAVYPKQAITDKVATEVAVILVVEIDATGAVTKATVAEPQGHGFDEAAVEASKSLVFEPATRDGQPIPARIKHRYSFPVPKSIIRGKVANQSSDRGLAAEVSVVGADGIGLPATVAADGTFTAEVATPGHYSVRVHVEGFTDPAPTELDLAAAEVVELTIRVARKEAPPEPKKPDAKEPDVEEVQVRGKKPPREVTKRTLEQRELSRIPGTNGDALRALQNLPGVARPPGLAGLLIVRGSAPNDTNIFIDGTLVPIVYHFGGLSSVVPTEALEKIDFYPGNFSAQYGRVMGGIVDVSLRDPKKDKLHGFAQVDLIDARALAEGPLGKGWSFLVAGRRSYVDTWLGPVLTAAGSSVSTAPVYYDYQAVLQKDIDKNKSFRLAFMGSDDRLALIVQSGSGSDPTLGGNISLGTAYYRLQARYRQKISDKTEWKTTAAVGKDSIQFNLGENYFKLTTHPITLRSELSHKLGSGVTMNVGMDWLYTPYEIAIRFPPIPQPGQPDPGPFGSRPPLTVKETDSIYRPAIYDELEIVPWKGGRVVTGVRVDYAKDTKSWDVSPRFVFRQDVVAGAGKRTTVKGGLGVFRQPPQPQETNKAFGQIGLTSNRAIHYTLGAERELGKNVEISMEGFYKDFDHLVVANQLNSGLGQAYGIETLVRYKPDSRFFGFLAYTLSRSMRRNSASEAERLFTFDQTHILTAVGSYRLGRGWEIGSRFRLTSGSLTTPQRYGFVDENSGSAVPLNAATNSERLPMYRQLDIRVDKSWQFKTWKLGAYLDVLNVYNAGNSEGVSYNYDSTLRTYSGSLPIIPSLGLRGEL